MPEAGGFESAFEAFARTIGPNSRLRYAPTPSGYLHEGNLLNFRLNYRASRFAHPPAHMLLRIDDLDAARARPDYIQNIFDTLRAQELAWDEGPVDAADFQENWSQLHRLPLYHELLARLRQKGLLYACAKSRKDLEAFGGVPPEHFRQQKLDLDAPDVAWRVRTPPGFPMPDFVVRRRDGVPAYQVATIADDLHFGVTHVIRGADLEPSTQAQKWLAEAAGLGAFAGIQFLHHPLIMGADGRKLSKSSINNDER